MTLAGVLCEVFDAQLNLLQWAKRLNNNGQHRIDLLALAPDVQDMAAVWSDGLENVDLERRLTYVVNTLGFIRSTQDPKF